MKRFFKGFVYAVNGIFKALKEERNLRFHIVTAVLVLSMSCFYNFSKTDYIILVLLIGGVIALEMVNSAIERAVDKPSAQHYQSAGDAKDIAAGAVLVYSVASAIIGVLMFLDFDAIKSIFNFALSNPIIAAVILILFALAYYWVFKTRKEDN